jgi:hypothetical protein
VSLARSSVAISPRKNETGWFRETRRFTQPAPEGVADMPLRCRWNRWVWYKREMELTLVYTEVPRFTAGSPASLEYLETNGYVVIANALDSEQAKSIYS